MQVTFWVIDICATSRIVEVVRLVLYKFVVIGNVILNKKKRVCRVARSKEKLQKKILGSLF